MVNTCQICDSQNQSIATHAAAGSMTLYKAKMVPKVVAEPGDLATLFCCAANNAQAPFCLRVTKSLLNFSAFVLLLKPYG